MEDEEQAYKDEILEFCKPDMEKIDHNLDRSVTGFPLPIHIDDPDEYDKIVEETLKRYVKLNEDKPALAANKKYPNLVSEVNEIVAAILRAIKYERQGDTEKARSQVLSILEKYNRKLFISELDSNYAFRGIAPFEEFRYSWHDYDMQCKYPLSFYRCRSGDKDGRISKCSEMLHVPLNKRSLMSSGRYSLSGIPCLYLATTTFCCWQELGCPRQINAVSFRVNEQGKQLKILNLAIDQFAICGFDPIPYEDMTEESYQMRLLFPLVIATSVCSQGKNSYRPEYTISHLIMRCLKDLKIDGVAYLSTQSKQFQYPQCVNLAIPVFSDAEQYGEICKCFEITRPQLFDIDTLPVEQNSASNSYINSVYCGDDHDPHTQIHAMGASIRYRKTSFSVFDDILASKPHYSFGEATSG